MIVRRAPSDDQLLNNIKKQVNTVLYPEKACCRNGILEKARKLFGTLVQPRSRPTLPVHLTPCSRKSQAMGTSSLHYSWAKRHRLLSWPASRLPIWQITRSIQRDSRSFEPVSHYATAQIQGLAPRPHFYFQVFNAAMITAQRLFWFPHSSIKGQRLYSRLFLGSHLYTLVLNQAN